ncbi:phage tail protein [Sphingomonas elodea]|uniref:phage tail protein n=1 Tax=Sphingomonas elodea TaxID=179878 RepID=UPI0002630592|nr:tail fiber protein [Sphingomonas elodea]
MDPFIGQIMQVGFRYAPVNWLNCNGTVMQINQNQALFALLGNSFGGNGTSNYALPDARGRVLMGAGAGPGLTPRNVGAAGGVEQQSLTLAQLPMHNHTASFTATSAPTFTGRLTAISGVAYADEVKEPQAGAYLGTVQEPDTTPTIYVPADKAAQPGAQPVPLAGVSGSISGVQGTVTVNPAGTSQPVPVLQPFVAVTTIIAAVGVWPEQP